MEKDQLNEARKREASEREAMKSNALRTLLTSEARERLANVKMVKPEVAEVIENSIIQQASTGRLKRRSALRWVGGGTVRSRVRPGRGSHCAPA